MSTELLFLKDAYQKTGLATVIAHTSEGGVVLDKSLFYATSGGQPGDSGTLCWDNSEMVVATTIKVDRGAIALVPVDGQSLPPVGTEVSMELDWSKRHGHMRVHTALHLLSVVIPSPVSGGSIGAEKGRLDFNMPDAPEDKAVLQAQLQSLIDQDLPVLADSITNEELEANPGLVKTMSVSPPRGTGHIRLIRIGEGGAQVDLQPCGGTHVTRTGEIGKIRLGKVEKKGKVNRRIYLHLEA
ncbi:alanyl-tRNA editing protein [Phaeobacter sp. NW0010-22]|uniref:alanyl-tRNA editing protein n=1 Tax=Phaeobacter sp. NW0010-22 TaxID=3135907 RepID=UPI003103B015